MTNKRTAHLGLGVLVAASAALVTWQLSESSSRESTFSDSAGEPVEVGMAENAQAAPPNPESADAEVRGAAAIAGAALSATDRLYLGVPRARLGVPDKEDPFVAKTAAEQQWLDRNGFPTKEEWARLVEAPMHELEAAAKEGDMEAAAMLNSKRLVVEADPRAVEELSMLGAQGSLFALDLLSAGLVRDDPVMAYAVTRVVEWRGDTRRGVFREGGLPQPLTHEQRMEGERQAAIFYNRLRAIAVREGYAGFRPDPRPWP